MLTLPKKYLSFSSLSLFYKNKDEFRRRYYESIKSPDSVYSMFGREVHEKIAKEKKYAPIRLPVAEHKIEVEVCGVPLLGYIDTIDPDDNYIFNEYKSGIRKPDGSPRWTQVDVQKHDQQPFYSMMIEEKYGVRTKTSNLVWLETAWEEDIRQLGGVTLSSGRRLVLTGHYEVFTRRIFQYDRDRMRRWVKQGAKAISEDYSAWLASR